MFVVHMLSDSSGLRLREAEGSWSWWTMGEGRREDREPLSVGSESLRSKRGVSLLLVMVLVFFLPVVAEKEKSSMVMRRDDSFADWEGEGSYM